MRCDLTLKQVVLLEEKKQSVMIFLGKWPSWEATMVLYVAALSSPNSGLSVPHIAFMNAQRIQMVATWMLVHTTITMSFTTATTLFDLANLFCSKMTTSKARVRVSIKHCQNTESFQLPPSIFGGLKTLPILHSIIKKVLIFSPGFGIKTAPY